MYCIDFKEQTPSLNLFKQVRNVLAHVPGMITVVPHRMEGPGLLSLPSVYVGTCWGSVLQILHMVGKLAMGSLK